MGTTQATLIFPDAKGNGYTNNIVYTHSSDLLTMQEIWRSSMWAVSVEREHCEPSV